MVLPGQKSFIFEVPGPGKAWFFLRCASELQALNQLDQFEADAESTTALAQEPSRVDVSVAAWSLYSMLRINASGPDPGLPGRISAGL